MEEAMRYLKDIDKLENKLTGEDKEIFKKTLFFFNECARNLAEIEKENQELKDRELIIAIELDKLQEENQQLRADYGTIAQVERDLLKERIKKALECIEKDTRWFDREYASSYGELCTCAGANANRLEVLVNPTNLSKILKGDDKND